MERTGVWPAVLLFYTTNMLISWMALSLSLPMTVTQTFYPRDWAYNRQELEKIYYAQKTKNHSSKKNSHLRICLLILEREEGGDRETVM